VLLRLPLAPPERKNPLKMKVLVNDSPRDVSDGATLSELLAPLVAGETGGVAAALNEVVVPREKWGETPLRARDSVLLIRAAQGG
jgi:sulfur carrier protein